MVSVGFKSRRTTFQTLKLGAPALGLLLAPCAVLAAEEEEDSQYIEEVTVTAQRVAESIQDVPIAVTALTGDDIEERQVITPSDLQMNASNVSFSSTNFGGSTFSIRGIGNLVIARTGEPGVSQHLNEIAVSTNLNILEFFDMERVEVLRGPQGTLFGRNATGGAINFITRKPELDGVNGYVDFEYGNYEHSRSKFAVNLPLADSVAVRVAAFQLERDGYTKNLAYGQTGSNGERLSGIGPSLDGRDILAYRGTVLWEISDQARIWGLYSRFEEDDNRARITNQVCVTNPIPTTGCLPDEFGFETSHLGATTAGIFAGAAGALPFGARQGSYDFPRPNINGFREMHTDFEPIYQYREELFAFGFDFDFSCYSASIIGARRDITFLAQQDYLMDVGASLGPSAENPSGAWPTSEPAGGAGVEWTSDSCNVLDGTAGLRGGCRLPAAQNRAFAFDQIDGINEYWTVEAKIHSNYEAPYGFLAGITALENFGYGSYYVLANTLDLVGSYGSATLQAPPLYPSFFMNSNDPVEGTNSDGFAAFGEVYYDLSDRMKLTAGLRYNEDDKSTSDSSVLFNSADVNAALGGLLGQTVWMRSGLLGEMSAIAGGTATEISAASQRLLAFHNAEATYATNAPAAIGLFVAAGAAQAIGAQVQAGTLPPAFIPAVVQGLPLPPVFQQTVLALLSGNPVAIGTDPGRLAGTSALAAIANAIGPAPAFGETRFITGSPTASTWKELSGRLGIDYRLDDGTLLYGFYSRGYKPGGFNPAIPPQFHGTTPFTFAPEQVNALEVGAKRTLMEGRLVVNAAAFYYDYAGLQITRIRNNTSINENIDARIMGVEIEGIWRPEAFPNAFIDFAYGWLDSAVQDSASIDPINRTGGNPAYVLLNNIDPGSSTATNYVANESQITAELLAAALGSGAALDIRNGATVESVSHPPNSAGLSIPAYFSRNFLDAAGVETLDGVPVDLDGNTLPNAPDHTLRLGLAYTWPVGQGDLTARWDGYWQTDSYAREFNARGDEIDSWMQHNLSLIYERDGWLARGWVRNVADSENVTGKYLTSDTSGFFRNYFVTEPRIFGVSVRYTFGE
ncbi:MAG: TonB-dependent receptor [Gammaproteobacteria bacterium]|nr:TonB-dependent receptor [Gammaproteobacteria bacterium]